MAAKEIIGHTPRILQGDGTDRAALEAIGEALTRREPLRIELRNYRKDGSSY